MKNENGKQNMETSKKNIYIYINIKTFVMEYHDKKL